MAGIFGSLNEEEHERSKNICAGFILCGSNGQPLPLSGKVTIFSQAQFKEIILSMMQEMKA